MKSFVSSFVLAVLVATSFTSGVSAQDGGIIAVLDVAKVFKASKDFDDLMPQAEGLKSQIQEQQEAIKSEAMQISQYEAGTAERNKMEAEIEQKQAALRTSARQAVADLLNQEAKVYYNTYVKMQTVVSELATKHGISMVVRYDGSPADPARRPKVLKHPLHTVVFQHDIDLTTMVIDGMGARVAEAGKNLK